MTLVRIDTPLLYLLTEEVKLQFAQSDQPKRVKEIVRGIFPIYHILWQPRANYRARAWAVNIKYKGPEKRNWHLSKRIHPYTRIGTEDYFMLVDFNISGAKWATRKIIKNLVSHELAHHIETVINKDIDDDGIYTADYQNDKKLWHNKLWQELHKAMGGNGKETAGF